MVYSLEIYLLVLTSSQVSKFKIFSFQTPEETEEDIGEEDEEEVESEADIERWSHFMIDAWCYSLYILKVHTLNCNLGHQSSQLLI